MAPPTQSTNPSKRSLHSNDPLAVKNDTDLQRRKKRKKKFSYNLGPQWRKGEIENFYEAYRKYGQDWGKVASAMYDRSIEMVEALYNMNKSYLALPEGSASVVGLTAMMKDYYNVMEGCDSQRENYDASGFQELSKTNEGKGQMIVSNEDNFISHSVAASGGCLSSLRSLYYCTGPRVVRRRTPRVPISYSVEKDELENWDSGNKSSQKSEFHFSSDEAAHGATLAMDEASQRRGSSATSVPYKIEQNMKSSYEVNGGRKGRPTDKYGYDPSSSLDIGSARTIKAHYKMKKKYRKEKVLDDKSRQLHKMADYLTENKPETSNTNGICSFSVPKGKVDSETPKAECSLSSPLVQRKKSRKLTRGDKNAALDALMTLADLSSTIPFTAMESKASVQNLEKTESFDLEEEAKLSARSREKGKQIMVNEISKVEDTGYGKSKPGRGLPVDVHSKRKNRLEHPVTMSKGKGNFVIPDTQVPVDVQLLEVLKTATSEHIKPTNNENQVTLPIKQGSRSRRKMELQKLLTHQKTKSCDGQLKKELMKCSPSVLDRVFFLKDKLSSCMSSTMVRRWCIFEWFYSAIDYPWFARREFAEYLDHVGLANIPRLTRLEWGVVRSSLGKPRRFSEGFLKKERTKLKLYRESARQYYAEVRAGTREGLPTDLARPLSVGQRIIALLPNTLEVHDGSVLAVKHDMCMIQFDDQEIGVKFVTDSDCMPFNPMNNFPEAFRHRNCSINKPSLESKEPQVKCHPNLRRDMEKASSPHTSDTLVPCATFNPEQYNTFSGNSFPLWLMPLANTRALSSIPYFSNVSQKSECGVVDIVTGSRAKAQSMVNVAIEVLLSTSKGDDPLTIICGALHSFESHGYQKPLRKSQEYMNDSLGHLNQSCSLEHFSTGDQFSLRSRHSNIDYGGIPSNLITSCVATLLMIQACIEHPYPPGNVAQILGLAVESLHPRCSKNLHFYKEIETCIGRIKTQLLAIVPT